MPSNIPFDTDATTGDYLVSFDPSTDAESAREELTGAGYRVLGEFEFAHSSESSTFVVDGDTATSREPLFAVPGVTDVSVEPTATPALAPDVATMSIDGDPPITPDDIHDLTSIGDTGGDGDGITVAIVDSGIDASHEHFDTHEGSIDGVDFTPNDAPLSDDVGHGTGVAGLYTELAPQVDLISLRVFGRSGSASGRRLLSVYEWLLDHTEEIDLFNMSLGFSRTVSRLNELHDRVVSQGVRGVTASGNSGGPSGTPATASSGFSVGSIAEDGSISRFSSYNPGTATNPELMAPGELVKLADPGAGMGNPGLAEDGYTAASGTSFSAPIAGALVARSASATNQNAKTASLPSRYAPTKVSEAYTLSARNIPNTPRDGAGVINQANAFRRLNPSRDGGEDEDENEDSPTSPEQPGDDSPDSGDGGSDEPEEPEAPETPDDEPEETPETPKQPTPPEQPETPDPPETPSEEEFEDYIERLLIGEFGEEHVYRQHRFERSARIADFVVFNPDQNVCYAYELENDSGSLLAGLGQATFYAEEALLEFPDAGSVIPVLCFPDGEIDEAERDILESSNVVLWEASLPSHVTTAGV